MTGCAQTEAEATMPAMDAFSQALIDRSGYETEGFPEVYDRYRPSPPRASLDILMLVAQVTRPRVVVDLGAGTGLFTRRGRSWPMRLSALSRTRE
jgi:hypothetical protein